MRKYIRPFVVLAMVLFVSASTAPVSRADANILSNLGLMEQLTLGAVDEVVTQLEISKDAPVVLVSLAPHEGNVFVKDRLAKALADRGFQVIVSRVAGDLTIEPAADEEEATEPEATEPEATDGDELAPGGVEAAQAARAARAAEAAAADAADSGESEPTGASDPVVLAEQALAHAKPGASSNAPTILDIEILEFGVRYSEVGRRLLLGPVQFTRVAGVYLRVTEHDGKNGYVEDMITAERHHWDRVSGRERLLAEGASYPFDRPELAAPGLGTFLEPALVVGIVSGLVFLFYENQN